DKNQILFRFHPEATWVYDRETLRFLAVNDAAMAQYGYSREEFLALTPKDIGALEEPAPLQEHSQLELKGPLRGPSFRHRKKDGTIIDIEMSTQPIKFEGRRANLIIAKDVSNQKQAEEALRVSEERYRVLFKEDLTGDFTATADAQLLSCNPAFVRTFGFDSVEEALRTN